VRGSKINMVPENLVAAFHLSGPLLLALTLAGLATGSSFGGRTSVSSP
jgi:hypothetical protein